MFCMKPSKLQLVFLIFFICGIVANTIGLAICIRYAFIPEINHYQQYQCNIDYCVTTPHTCCSKGRFGSESCHSCPTIAITYTLDLNETFCTKSYPDGRYKWFTYDVCAQPTITCYYDDRYINNTLSLDHVPPPPGPTAGVVILSITLTVFLVALVVWMTCYFCNWMHRKE